MAQEHIWRTILAAWSYQPIEQGLDTNIAQPEGVTAEWSLQQSLFGEQGIPDELKQMVRQAHQWAAAADSLQFKKGEESKWSQVAFSEQPELIHPLSGETITATKRLDITFSELKQVSQDHFESLLHHDGSSIDFRATALAYWRFGPDPLQIKDRALRELWSQLPADARTPDHTVWDHIDLSSAFSVAFTGDKQKPALLQMAFGPIQDFIAQARTTSDLWAGSHLLSRIAWEGMRVICDRLGPESILFPQLRGIPLADRWLQQQGVRETLFAQAKWKSGGSDSNPLFSAALPNKFLALVPDSMADELAHMAEQAVRDWMHQQGQETVKLLFDKAQQAQGYEVALEQLERQLEGFPEVHWTVVPWQDERSGLEALSALYPAGDHPPGFFGSKMWRLLQTERDTAAGVKFAQPNGGTLYPVNYELAERTLAATKGLRPFSQLEQEGYRCSLCGEREWLSHDRELLNQPPGKRESTLWSNLKQPSLARKGEHLCGVCATKRLWPSRFAAEVSKITGGSIRRYVVSTHTMALVTSLEQWRKENKRVELIERWYSQLNEMEPVSLPGGLSKKLHQEPETVKQTIRKLPALVQHFQDHDEDTAPLDQELNRLFTQKPESYYAMILLDGDSMGSWLSASEGHGICYGEALHSRVRQAVQQQSADNEAMAAYIEAPRVASPGRHISISTALNNFSANIVPYVVEEMFNGKLLYAGGDDVLAMVPVDDLLPCLTILRHTYSGNSPSQEAWKWLGDPAERPDKIDSGHIYLQNQFYRMMGYKATASAGAVIAHHQAPLGKVLTELRGAEGRAKNNGRDSFSITVLRRSGGRSDFTGKWQLNHKAYGFESSPAGLLLRVRAALSSEGLSRRAAYILQEWLRQMPEIPDKEMLVRTMGYQMDRQGGERQLGEEIAKHACRLVDENILRPEQLKQYLSEQVGIAEFLARGGRGE